MSPSAPQNAGAARAVAVFAVLAAVSSVLGSLVVGSARGQGAPPPTEPAPGEPAPGEPSPGEVPGAEAPPTADPAAKTIRSQPLILPKEPPLLRSPDASTASGADAAGGGDAGGGDGDAASDAEGGPDGADPDAWRASLEAREAELEATRRRVEAELAELRELSKAVEERHRDARRLLDEARAERKAVDEAPASAGGGALSAAAVLPGGLEHVVGIMKKMKPTAGAEILRRWPTRLAVDVILRLPARVVAPVMAVVPPDDGTRITRALAEAEVRRKVRQTTGGGDAP